MMRKLRLALGAFIGAVFISGAALAQSFDGEIGAGRVLGNPSASQATATDASLTAMFDRAFCGTNNSAIARIAGSWVCQAPLGAAVGGTGQASYAVGDMLYASGATTLSKLAAGTSGYALIANGAGVASTYQGFLQAGTGAVTRTWQDKARDAVNVKDFGAACDNVADDTAEIQAALNTGRAILVPDGICLVTGLTMSAGNTQIIGESQFGAQLKSTSTSTPVITVAAGLNVGIFNLTVSHSGTPISGGDGIKFSGHTAVSTIENVYSQNNYVGFNLGPTNFSVIKDSYVTASISHGVLMSPTAATTTFQWQIDGLLTENNGGDNMRVTSVGGPVTNTSLGNWDRFNSFSGSGVGLRILCETTKPCFGLRLSNSFFGGEPLGSILLDTYGSDHNIWNTFVEQSPSHGINISANNTSVFISNTTSKQNTGNGLITSAALTSISGGQFSDNTAVGIEVGAAGRLAVDGVSVRTNNAGILIGAFAVNGTVTGSDVTNNSTAFTNSSTGCIDRRGNKGVTDAFCGSTSGSTVLQASATASGTLTLPAATDTLVGKATTDTLTNKTLTNPTIAGGSITSLTTFGLASGGVGNLLFASTENLTANRTLTVTINDAARTFNMGGNLTTAGAASLPSIAQGDIWYGSASGVISALAKDANATRYVSNTGGSNNPAWAQVNLANGVTGTLPVANGGTADTGTAWTTYTPTLTCGVGSATSTNTGRYKQLGKTMFIELRVQVTAVGTCTTSATLNLPTGTAAADFALHGWDYGLTGVTQNALLLSGGTTFALKDHTSGFPIATNAVLVYSGVIEIQ